MRTAYLSAPVAPLPSRGRARHVPFVLAARQSIRPLPMTSLRVPVTPANRNYLRQLRRAEMRAWQNHLGGDNAGSAERSAAGHRREQTDLYRFGLIVALTIILAGVMLTRSSAVTQHCTPVVDFVRQLLG